MDDPTTGETVAELVFETKFTGPLILDTTTLDGFAVIQLDTENGPIQLTRHEAKDIALGILGLIAEHPATPFPPVTVTNLPADDPILIGMKP